MSKYIKFYVDIIYYISQVLVCCLVFFCPPSAQHEDEIECRYTIWILRGRGGGVLGVWVIWFVQEFFSPKPLVIEFSPDMQRGNIFSSVICHERYFFQCRNIFRRASPYKKFFPPRNQSVLYFSLKSLIPLPPSKVKWSAHYRKWIA